jgi:hypothetical protein
MKTAYLAMLLGAFGVSGVAAQEVRDDLPSAPQGKTWKMVWHDEFDGTKLDETKWTPRPEGKRKGGWWSPKAVSLDGKGDLVVKTYREGEKVIDGCITTQGKFEHAFGYYVARVRFQKQPGHWSAFWLTCPGVHIHIPSRPPSPTYGPLPRELRSHPRAIQAPGLPNRKTIPTDGEKESKSLAVFWLPARRDGSCPPPHCPLQPPDIAAPTSLAAQGFVVPSKPHPKDLRSPPEAVPR